MDLTRVLKELKSDPQAADAAKAMQELVDAGEIEDSDALGSLVEELLAGGEQDPDEDETETEEAEDAGKFKEEDHPRKDDGKFGSGGTNSPKHPFIVEKVYSKIAPQVGASTQSPSIKQRTSIVEKAGAKIVSLADLGTVFYGKRGKFEKFTQALRKGDLSDAKMKTEVALLDKAMKGSKLKEPLEVYRGINEDIAAKILKGGKGFSFQDSSYVATTVDPLYAQEVYSDPFDTDLKSGLKDKSKGYGGKIFQKAIIQMKLPKGQSGVFIQQKSGSSSESWSRGKEGEFLLPRNSEFVVEDIDTQDSEANEYGIINRLHVITLIPKQSQGEDESQIATDPPVSEKQRRAMFAAAAGKSTLGISKEVGEKFVGSNHDEAPEVKSRAAGVIFLTPDGHVLMLQRAEKGDHEGTFCFPGGMLEGEETPLDAARREAEEEVGQLPEGEMHPFHTDVSPEGLEYTTFVQSVPEMFEPQINDESTQAVWRGLDNLPQPLHPGVKEMLAKDFSIGQLSSEELKQFRAFPPAKQQKIVYLLEKIKRNPDQTHKFQQELDAITGDMAPEDWDGLRNGLNKFLDEEEAEPEHADDAECGPPASSNPKAKPTGSGGGAIDEQKCSHTEVAYSCGKPESHCGICKFFHDQGCELVVDPIERFGWCKLFTADSEDAVEAAVEEAEDEFKETDHPRKDDGKFGSGGGGASKGNEEGGEGGESEAGGSSSKSSGSENKAKGVAAHAAKVKDFLKQPNVHKIIATSAGKFLKEHGLGVLNEHLHGEVIIPAIQASVGLALEHLGASVPESIAVSVAGYAVHKLMTKMGYGPENTHKLLLSAGKALLSVYKKIDAPIQRGLELKREHMGDAQLEDDQVKASLQRLVSILEKTKTKDLMKAAAPPKEQKDKAEDKALAFALDEMLVHDHA